MNRVTFDTVVCVRCATRFNLPSFRPLARADLLVAFIVPSALCPTSIRCLEIARFFELAVWQFRFLILHCGLTLTLTFNMSYEL